MRVLRTIGFDRTWARAEGAYLYDADGTRYLDLLGGFGMYGVGRNNPRSSRRRSSRRLELETPGMLAMGTTLLPGLLAEALIGLAGGRIERCLFTSSGTEAVESALKLGRAATGRAARPLRRARLPRPDARLALGQRQRGVHGSASSRCCPGFEQVPFGDLDALEAELRREDVALFLVEPVQGKGIHLLAERLPRGCAGAVPPLRDALLRRRGDDRLRADGPDVRVPALGTRAGPRDRWPKTLSGGYVPSGALLMARSVHEAVFDSMPHAMSHGSTFAPNELAMAAGLATLHELRERSLVEQSARLGERLLELTRPLVDEFEVVRDVRGLGLAWAIEFAEPQGGGRITYRMIERAQRGLFAQLVVVPLFTKRHILTQVAGHDMAVIRILPPLVVTDEDVEEFAAALRATIKGAQRMPVVDEVRADGRECRAVAPLAALERETTVRPLAPPARVEATVAARQPGAVERDARGDARAAVGDELAVGKLRQRLVRRCVRGTGDPARRVVDLVRLAAPAAREPGVDERERRSARRRAISSAAIVSPLRSRTTNSSGSISSSPARSSPLHASIPPSRTAQSSCPKWRSSHQSRSAPPPLP